MDTTSTAKNLSRHYERIYNVEDDFRNYNLSLLVASLARGKKVLDLGCGSGFLLDYLSKMGFKTVGLEPNRDQILLAKKRNAGLDIREGGAEDIDSLVLEEVDTVLAIDVLEHLKDDALVLRKVHRRLASEGLLIVVVPAYPWLYGRRDEKYGHFRRYSKNKLESLLAREGFKVVSRRYWNMLGVSPYIFYEKILRKELETGLREEKAGMMNRFLKKMFHFWFRFMENKINFGFGLSMILVVEKTS